MKRSPSPITTAKRAPSPSQSPSPLISHSRSLPSTLGTDRPSPGIFRRVVSDRVRQAVEGMKQKQRDVAAEDDPRSIVSPRRGRKRNVDPQSDENIRGRGALRSPIRKPRSTKNPDLVSPTRKSSRKIPSTIRNNSIINGSVPHESPPNHGPAGVHRAVNHGTLPSPPVVVKTEPEDWENVGGTPRGMRQRAAGLFASLPTSFSFSNGNGTTPESSPVRRRRVMSAPTVDHSHPLIDIIMWRNFAKSTLIFGFGSFFILSLSLTKEMQFNLITFISYAALIYLSIVFLRKNIIQRCETPCTWTLNEGTALEITRGALPAVNFVLCKLSQLFSGDPTVTLKVAAVLWFLAQAGYRMSLWNLVCLGFFAAFTVPKLYVAYSSQLEEHGNHGLSTCISFWEKCRHKKALALAVLVALWNFSSVSAKLWICFLSIVAFRKFQSSEVPADSPPLVAVKQES